VNIPAAGSHEVSGSGPLLLVTRPAAQASDWVSKLRARHLRAEALPLIATGPAPDAAALRHMLACLVPGALVMFVSPNAVLHAFAALGPGAAWPQNVRAAATGPGTVDALRAAGVPAAQIVAPPESAGQFDSEALWGQLRGEAWRGRPVWVVRGEGGRDWFADTLRAAGAAVHFVQGYSRQAPVLDAAGSALLQQALQVPQSVRWLFSSSEGIDHLAALAPGADWAPAVALVSHPRIAARARALGVGRVHCLAPGVDAIVAALLPPSGV